MFFDVTQNWTLVATQNPKSCSWAFCTLLLYHPWIYFVHLMGFLFNGFCKFISCFFERYWFTVLHRSYQCWHISLYSIIKLDLLLSLQISSEKSSSFGKLSVSLVVVERSFPKFWFSFEWSSVVLGERCGRLFLLKWQPSFVN